VIILGLPSELYFVSFFLHAVIGAFSIPNHQALVVISRHIFLSLLLWNILHILVGRIWWGMEGVDQSSAVSRLAGHHPFCP
jgi:hypothetical protein